MKIRSLETEPTDGQVERQLLDTSSQRSKTLPILDAELRAAIVRTGGNDAQEDLRKGPKE